MLISYIFTRLNKDKSTSLAKLNISTPIVIIVAMNILCFPILR